MMTGTVNADLEPLLRVIVRDVDGDLPWLCRQQGQLADGSVQAFDVHVAKVDWHGQARSVEVESAKAQPLLGMALMKGSELHIPVDPGSSLTITELPCSDQLE